MGLFRELKAELENETGLGPVSWDGCGGRIKAAGWSAGAAARVRDESDYTVLCPIIPEHLRSADTNLTSL